MARRPSRLVLCEGDGRRLEEVLASRTVERRVFENAQILHLKSECARTDCAAACIANDSESKVQRVVARYREGGLEHALRDLPRSGRPQTVCPEDELWVVTLACSKPKDVGGTRELWYASLFCDFVRAHAEAAGHPRMASACDKTIERVLAQARLQPFRLRYYCVRTDPDYERKMTVLLANYRQLAECFGEDGRLDHMPTNAEGRTLHVLSYDEKPGIQVLACKVPDLMPDAGRAAAATEAREAEGRGASMYGSPARYYEYVRNGTQSLLCAIDLLDGRAFPLVEDRHTSAEYVAFLRGLDAAYPEGDVIRLIEDNHSVHTSRETQEYLNTVPGRFEFVFPPTHSSWCNLVEGFFSTLAKQLLDGIRCGTKEELRERVYAWFREFNAGGHAPRRWTWALDGERYDLDSVDPNEEAFRVVNGAACRPEDAHLRAARPKPVRKPRGQRGVPDPEERGVRYEDGSLQMELPIDWASVNFPRKEAA